MFSITRALLLALLPMALAASSSSAAKSSDTTSYVGATIPAAFKDTSTPTAAPSLFVVANRFSSLHSNDNGEGTGQEEKRPYGVDGPNDVAFGFYASNGYTSETFRVSYYKSVADASATGEDGQVAVSAWKTGDPTSVIECANVKCVASATASPTEDVYVTPVPDMTTTTEAFEIKCTGV
ncbi:hypothetical protein I350_02426 [Cryptococcus amylolentus CBS 6273]|uniref:Uncharacterized protein n=1 Tax=Cryptococcus amylolentus CBS 6273 TaxID=1296118 RepID=A0A1E3KC90_9TREE|nr:hypothetical protein I350_02426 [Cryptococcus amylolentus CBS 6273]